MSLVLFGPPGAGKGTQSSLLVSREGYTQISTGDLLRAAIHQKTALGLEAQRVMDQGLLVSDEIVLGLVKARLIELGGKKFILDGYPRNVAQADALFLLLEQMNLKVNVALFIDVPFEILKRRLLGRRVCKNCGATYHEEFKPESKAGVCDACGGEVVQRGDDTEAAIVKRLETYEKSTLPLKEYFGGKGLLKVVSGLGETEDVFKDVKKSVN